MATRSDGALHARTHRVQSVPGPGRILRLLSLAALGAASTLAQAQVFEDVSVSAGFEPAFLANIPAGGIAVADFDGNGWPDIFVTGYLQPNRLFFNQGNGQFIEDPAINAMLPGTRCSVTAAADFDNDGWPDLYVGCREQQNYLLRNLQGQGFADVTPVQLNHSASGGNSPRTDAVAWGDLTGNGHLDIYIGIYPTSSEPDLNNPDNLDRIVLNHGDGNWSIISSNFTGSDRAKLGRTALAAVIADIDRDGRPDIYVVNDKLQGNVLWRNLGPGCGGWCFSDVAPAAGAAQLAFGMGIAVGDVDRNGIWDMYVSDIDLQHFLRGVATQPLQFQEEPQSPLNHFGVGWGTIFADFDNDGWEDAFLAVGSGSFSTTSDRDQLFRNMGAGVFSVISNESGLAQLRPTQAAARIDFDRDGRTDLVLGHWNQGYRLYRNTGPAAGSWIGFELEGGGAVNRDALGAVLTLETADGARQIRELRAGESRGSSHDQVLHFGLGDFTVAEVSVRWPDGLEQALGSMPAGSYHRLIHPAAVLFADGFEP